MQLASYLGSLTAKPYQVYVDRVPLRMHFIFTKSPVKASGT